MDSEFQRELALLQQDGLKTNPMRLAYEEKMRGLQALKEELAEINPYLDITADCIKVTEDNIAALFAADDMICEAFDDPEAKAMLANGILELYPEKFLIAASGMAGYGESNAIHTRKITEHFYLCGDEKTEPSYGRGLMAPRVAVCAAHEANLITELILR